jgi:hypothetical protein
MFVYNNGTNVVEALKAIPVAAGGTGLATLTANNVLIGNGTGNVTFVAPSTTGNVLTSNGTTWTSAAAAAFDVGTVMLFAQTSAPTGWTKNSSTGDNSALRVTTGAASTGGSVAFTTAFASQTPTGSVSVTAVSGSAGSTTLSTPEIPTHRHSTSNTTVGNNPADYPTNAASGYGGNVALFTSPVGSNPVGGSGGHTHPFSFSSGSGSFSGNAINLAVQYIDVIRATKN